MTTTFQIQQGLEIQEENLREKIGTSGYSQLQLAALNIPVNPGFIIEISKLKEHPQDKIRRILDRGIQTIEKETGRKFGDKKSPLLLKVSLSPGIILETAPTVPYFGLNNQTVQSIAAIYDQDYAFTAYSIFIQEFSPRFMKIDERELNHHITSSPKTDSKTICGRLLADVIPDFPQNPYNQIETALYGMANTYLADPLNHDIPASIIIQAIPYGNRETPSFHGSFITRDPKTGDPRLSGNFTRGENIDDQNQVQEIHMLDQNIIDKFEEIAGILEGFFLDIRQVEFFIENGKIYVIKLKDVEDKSVITRLRILGDLHKENQISDEEFIKSISPGELNSLLYATINQESVKETASVQGGITGSFGATSGRIYFSTEKLIEAFWQAKADESDTSLILLKRSTFAEDVQAVEIGNGVITSEGGYTSHAPIVARSLGKPAIILPDIVFGDNHVSIGNHIIKEGQYISMEITDSAPPVIYFGKAELEYPDIEKSGIKNLLDKAKQFAMGIKIYANADNPKEARYARHLGADGIGLCRTEHMLLKNNRIYDFRELLITREKTDKTVVLERIKSFLTSDFEELFEIMNGMPLTIRLLDAPLHEFLPSDEEELNRTLAHFSKMPANMSKEDIFQSFTRLKETNPMLGHRGCRVGISTPEIYDIQTSAILEAALKVKKEKKIDVQPAIMIPLIMSQEEMYLIKNGQKLEGKENVKGVIGIIREFMRNHQLERQPFTVRIGAMIELPAAALSADEIAKQAEFFSFGTNDLTQTTMGLSRDDINSFLPTYTEMDIWKSDPFQDLAKPVKTLISEAIRSGRQVRPDLQTGICGEHGANPEVIKYCLKIGMDYISCSPSGIPIAILTVAQSNLSGKT